MQDQFIDVHRFLLIAAVLVRGCTSGFPTEATIRAAAVHMNGGGKCRNPSDVTQHAFSQFLVPHMKFTCSGVVTRWTIGAEDVGGNDALVLQIWRPVPSATTIYQLVHSVELQAESLLTSECNVHAKALDEADQLSVESGDIVGVRQGRINGQRATYGMYYRSAAQTSYQFPDDGVSPRDISGVSGVSMEPLVTVGEYIKILTTTS